MKINDALNVLKNHEGSRTYDCFVPSLNRKVAFRDLTVAEMKSMSKMALDSTEHIDNVYIALTAMIINVALEKLDYTVLNEADRISILACIKKNNIISPERYYITCKKCKNQYIHTIDFDKIIDKLKDMPKPKTIKFLQGELKYEIQITLPSINLLYNFKEYCNAMITESKKKMDTQEKDESEKNGILRMANRFFLDYSNLLFVKTIKINDELLEDFNENTTIVKRNNLLDKLPAKLITEIDVLIEEEKSWAFDEKLKQKSICTEKGCGTKNDFNLNVNDFFV